MNRREGVQKVQDTNQEQEQSRMDVGVFDGGVGSHLLSTMTGCYVFL
jgi:hypothetical protein